MLKCGKIVIKKDNEVYEFNEKKFFQKENGKGLLYKIFTDTSDVKIDFNRFVCSVEFIDYSFSYLNRLQKKELSITSVCPIKITNTKLSKSLDIIIDSNYSDVEIKNVETTEPSKLEIYSEGKILITDVKNIGLDISSEEIDVLNYSTDLKHNEISFIGTNVALTNIAAHSLESVRIVTRKNLNWVSTTFESKDICIKGVLNTLELKNCEDKYIIDDEKIKELLLKNNLYCVLKGLKDYISSKKMIALEEFDKQKVYNFVKKNTK